MGRITFCDKQDEHIRHHYLDCKVAGSLVVTLSGNRLEFQHQTKEPRRLRILHRALRYVGLMRSSSAYDICISSQCADTGLSIRLDIQAGQSCSLHISEQAKVGRNLQDGCIPPEDFPFGQDDLRRIREKL